MHGGASPSGLGSPNFKTGRYSKHLPAKLADRYHEAVNDADLLAMRDDIALLDARIGERLATLTEHADDPGVAHVVWQDVSAYVEQRRKLVETEQKRLIAMQQMMTAEQAALLLGAVAGVIRKHVNDRPTLAAISADLAQLAMVEPTVGRALPARSGAATERP